MGKRLKLVETTPKFAEGPADAGHNSTTRLPFDDDDVRFIVQRLEAQEAIVDEKKAALKRAQQDLAKITNFGQDKGIPAEWLKKGRDLAKMKDQTSARNQPLILIRIASALGVEFKEDLVDNMFASPFQAAGGTSNPAEEELEWEARGKREAMSGKGVDRGYLPDGIPAGGPTQAYLRGQEKGFKANENAFLRKNNVDPETGKKKDDAPAPDENEGDPKHDAPADESLEAAADYIRNGDDVYPAGIDADADDDNGEDHDPDLDGPIEDGDGDKPWPDDTKPKVWAETPVDHIVDSALSDLAKEGGAD